MGNFQGDRNRGGGGGYRGGNGGGRPSFGGGRDNRGGGRGGDRGPVTMHKAVCDECHKGCEVPFRPSAGKPIYCNDCFSSKRDDGDRAPRRPSFGGDRGEKRDFSKSSSNQAPVQDDVKKQLGEINIKLDRLISALDKFSLPKEAASSATHLEDVKKVAKKTPSLKSILKKAVKTKPETKKTIVKKDKKPLVKKKK